MGLVAPVMRRSNFFAASRARDGPMVRGKMFFGSYQQSAAVTPEQILFEQCEPSFIHFDPRIHSISYTPPRQYAILR